MTSLFMSFKLARVRILGVCGSLQRSSENWQLLRVARGVAAEGVVFVLFDGLDALPHFNPDLEREQELPAVTALRDAVRASDALFIASPEYGHSLPGVLKNAIDWLIGSGELEQKLVAVAAAAASAERGRLGLRALVTTLGAVRARIIGGEPIVRGPDFERNVALLLSALVARVRLESASS